MMRANNINHSCSLKLLVQLALCAVLVASMAICCGCKAEPESEPAQEPVAELIVEDVEEEVVVAEDEPADDETTEGVEPPAEDDEEPEKSAASSTATSSSGTKPSKDKSSSASSSSGDSGGSGSSSSSGSSGGGSTVSSTKPAASTTPSSSEQTEESEPESEPVHQHNWIYVEPVTEEVWVGEYETVVRYTCGHCGTHTYSFDEAQAHQKAEALETGTCYAYYSNSYKELVGEHYETVVISEGYYYCSCGATK